jgi:REP element-mobilizing transposase RayT
MLQLNTYYHLYNHANSNENLFKSDNNYTYFLSKFNQYISPIADTYAYCLMPNHFHFLVKIKDEAIISNLSYEYPSLNPQGFKNLEGFISQQFSNFFNAYTKAFNKMYDRKGALFLHNFKRKEVNHETYFAKLIHYIHANPVHHGFTTQIEAWQFSSYQSYISEKKTKIKQEEALTWFGGLEAFKKAHKEPIDRKFKVVFD